MTTIVRLDGRYKAHPHFKFAVNYGWCDNAFISVRNWCWEILGPSIEINLFLNRVYRLRDISYNNLVWSWDNDYEKIGRLYFASDEQLSLFKLKWL